MSEDPKRKTSPSTSDEETVDLRSNVDDTAGYSVVRGAASMQNSTDIDATGEFVHVEEPDCQSNFGDAPKPSTGGTSPIDGYRVLGELGRGAMGVVYRAKQLRADRIVALKVMLNLEHARPEDIERFRIEAQSSAQLQHPGIVQVYEVGENDGLPYFTLEYVQGGTLARLINKQLLGHRETATTMSELSNAVAYAHSKGVIHRDLKPANILIDEEGKLKVADFGLARRTEEHSHLTRDGTILGTPSYMAPEQASGSVHAIGPLSDVYSMGAILYEMLTGRPPFKGSTVWEVIDLVRSTDPTPPSEMRPGVPKDLETICLKCLQKDPEKRYSSASNLSADLQRYLNDEPILARPVGQWERLIRLCRRHPRESKLVGAVAGLLLLFGLGATWSAMRISSQRDEIAAEKRISDERLTLYRDSVSDFVNRVPQLLEGVPLASGVRDEVGELTRELIANTDEANLSAVGASKTWGLEALAIRRGDLKLGQYAALRQNGGDQTQASTLLAKAQADFTEARELAQSVLDAGEGDRAKGLANLALAISRQAAALLSSDQVDAARSHYQDAIELRRAAAGLPDGDSPQVLRQAELARELTNYAELQLQRMPTAKSIDEHRRLLDESRALSEQATELLSKVLEVLPAESDSLANIRRDLSLAAAQCASIYVELDLPELAQAAFERAIFENQSLIQIEPNRVGHRKNLVAVANAFGDFMLVNQGDAASARKQYVVAMLQLRHLFGDPDLQQLREAGLAMSYYRLGLAALASEADEQEKSAQALKYFSRCELIRDLDYRHMLDLPGARANPDLLFNQRIALMLAQARSGNTQPAIATARQLVARASESSTAPVSGGFTAEQLYAQAAAGLGICAMHTTEGKRQMLLSEAVTAMQQAIEAGFSDAQYLQTDPDLAPLRESPQFLELVAQLR